MKRVAIVNAALDEFVEKGFAAARMEDIARRAGVAKGTIYLNFSDKEALFEAIVRKEIGPKVDAAAILAASGGSLSDFIHATFLPALDEITQTRRGAVLRLLIGEAGRVPKLAEVYYRVIVEPGLRSIRLLVEQAIERGELRDDLLVQFPQLFIAPMLLAVIWTGLFERFQTLDLKQMARAYYDHVIQCEKGQRRASANASSARRSR